jgi:DNA (cytosine-5)-methyltransferase 3A
MNVLSLFDGMSCGQIALNKLGIKYDKYFAAEIDKYAMQVTQHNFPDTVQLGDVQFVTKETFGTHKIDLLIGGSPCQGFSFAGKQLNFEDPRSVLFFEFVRLLKELKPKYFLLENVKMKKESQDIISKYLGCEPIEINSSLVSAQTRKRLYWTNIPNINQPEDKGIILKDIIEPYVDEKYYPGQKLLDNYDGNGQLNPDYKSQANAVHSGDKFPTICAGTHGYAFGYLEHLKQVDNKMRHPVKMRGLTLHSPTARRAEVER